MHLEEALLENYVLKGTQEGYDLYLTYVFGEEDVTWKMTLMRHFWPTFVACPCGLAAKIGHQFCCTSYTTLARVMQGV